MNGPIYLDNHSGTKPLPEVIDIYQRASKEYYGDPFAPHFMGQQQRYPREKGEKEIAQIFGVEKESISFFHSGKEALEKVLLSVYLEVSRTTGKTLFLHGTENDAFTPLASLGAVIRELPLDDKGRISVEALEKSITPKTALVFVPFADPATGVIHPIADLGRVCKEKQVTFVVDASHAFGKRFFRFSELEVDYLIVDGKMIHALSETSFMISKEIISSTLSEVAAITALAYGAGETESRLDYECMEVARLRNLLENSILTEGLEASICFATVDRLPGASAIKFPKAHAESLLYLLNAEGIYAKVVGENTLLFTLSFETTEEEVLRTVKELTKAVGHLQSLSRGVFA